MITTTLSKIGAACVLAVVLHGSASAGDDVRVLPLASDNRGNQAWVEIESGSARMKATPFVGVADEHVRKTLEGKDDKGTITLPFPQLMRIVEHARRSIRNMKRPAANGPAGDTAAGAAPQATAGAADTTSPPVAAMRLAPPEKAGAAIRPPLAQFSASAPYSATTP